MEGEGGGGRGREAEGVGGVNFFGGIFFATLQIFPAL